MKMSGKDWVNSSTRAKYKYGASRKESRSKAKKSFNLLHKQADVILVFEEKGN